MTFIQPRKYFDLQNFALVALVVLILGGTFWMVVEYNKTVDLSQDIITAKAQVDSIGAANTTLNNQIVATLGGGQIGNIAAADDLVQDSHPQYLSINQQWPTASQ